jgi:hypothetical protein
VCALVLSSALVCAVPRAADAQTPESAGVVPVTPDLTETTRVLTLIGAALSLVPAGLGVDGAVGATAVDGARFVLAWPFQLPLALRDQRLRTATFSADRVVLAPGLAFGPQWGAARRADEARERTDVTFVARVGYRYVGHPGGGWFGVLAGAGTGVEFWPSVRASFSPEIGLHLGACCGDAAAVVTVVLRGDAWFVGDNRVRLGAAVGWAFY